MKSNIIRLFLISIIIILVTPYAAQAYWVWTPETKKFINPKYAVKDSPAEQYNWAMDFYDAKDYTRAIVEFEKLVKNYEYSEYAAKAQYYIGRSYENEKKYYFAYTAYQKALDNYPRIENIEEIIKREFDIANIYANKESPKVLGTDIMTSDDRAIEIFKKVVDNAPFGRLAEEAQFRLGEVLKDAGRYDEATLAFQKIIDDYPKSSFLSQARYEMANCAYMASLKPAYDAAPTEKALKAFEDFANENKDAALSSEADKTMNRLKDKAAQKSFNTAKFYEKMNHPKSAIIYYKDVVEKYSGTPTADIALQRIECLNRPPEPKRSIIWTPWSTKWMESADKVSASGNTDKVIDENSIVEKTAAEGDKGRSGKGWFSWFGKKDREKAPGNAVKSAPVRSEGRVRKSWFSFGSGDDASKKTPSPEKAPNGKKMKWSIFAPISYFDQVNIPPAKIDSRSDPDGIQKDDMDNPGVLVDTPEAAKQNTAMPTATATLGNK